MLQKSANVLVLIKQEICDYNLFPSVAGWWNVTNVVYPYGSTQQQHLYRGRFSPGSLEVGVINSQDFRSQKLLDSCFVYLFCPTTHQRLRQNKLGILLSAKQH